MNAYFDPGRQVNSLSLLRYERKNGRHRQIEWVTVCEEKYLPLLFGHSKCNGQNIQIQDGYIAIECPWVAWFRTKIIVIYVLHICHRWRAEKLTKPHRYTWQHVYDTNMNIYMYRRLHKLKGKQPYRISHHTHIHTDVNRYIVIMHTRRSFLIGWLACFFSLYFYIFCNLTILHMAKIWLAPRCQLIMTRGQRFIRFFSSSSVHSRTMPSLAIQW